MKRMHFDGNFSSDTFGTYVPHPGGKVVLREDAIAAIEAAYREGHGDGVRAGYATDPMRRGAKESKDWHNSEAKRKAESSDE